MSEDNGYRQRLKTHIMLNAYGGYEMTEAKRKQLTYEFMTKIGREGAIGTRLHETIEYNLPKFEITPEFVEQAGFVSEPKSRSLVDQIHYEDQAAVYTYGLRTSGLIGPGTCGNDIVRLRDADRACDRYERGLFGDY